MIIKKLNEATLNFYVKLIEQDKLDFEVFIDGMRVCARSNNVERLFDAKDMLDSNSKEFVLKIYQGQSNRNEKITFLIQNETLQGIDNPTQQAVKPEEPRLNMEEIKANLRKEWQAEQDKTNEKQDLLDEIEELKEKLAEATAFQSTFSTGLKTLAGIIGQTPAVVDKFPALAGLGGFGGLGNAPQETQTDDDDDEEPKVRFAPKSGGLNGFDVPNEHKEALKEFIASAKQNPQNWALMHATMHLKQVQVEKMIDFIKKKTQ